MASNTVLEKQEIVENKTVVTEATRSKPSTVFLAVKRMFDSVFAVLCILVFLVPMAVIYIVVALTSPGGAVFKQERLGLNGKSYWIYKFRSMRCDAENDGPQLAVEDDPRCTKVGLFLRRTKLDELPQLFNILVGQMSFVGPRPERPYYYDLYDDTVVGFRERLSVKPGLTGLAQLTGKYSIAPELKIQYDLDYINRMSLGLDAVILIKTPIYLLRCLRGKEEGFKI